MTNVAFIGLGIMGNPMAGHLAKAGHTVTGFNRHPNYEDLEAAGGKGAGSLEEAVADADVVCVMVPDSPDVRDVLEGEGGVFDSAKPGTLVVDFSSIRPDVTVELAEAGHGARLPAHRRSGLRRREGREGRGRCRSWSAATPKDVEEARPLLEIVGKTVVHVGGSGSGQTVKAANQLIVATNIQALAEAVVFLKAYDVDLESALEVLGGGLAGSAVLNQKKQNMVNGSFEPGFRIDLHHKDMGIVTSAAREAGVVVPRGRPGGSADGLRPGQRRRWSRPLRSAQGRRAAQRPQRGVVVMTRMRSVDAAVLILEKEGATQTFGLPGAAINPFYRAMKDHGGIKHILARHVEAASHMAEGYTRAKAGNIGICVGTSGPAGTDMITGLYAAIADSIPILCITGQAPVAKLHKEDFQAVDIASIAAPVSKWAVTVLEPAQVPGTFQKAFQLMRSGRPGPGAHRPADRRAARRDRVRHRDLRAAAGRQAGRPPAHRPRRSSPCSPPRSTRSSSPAAASSTPTRPTCSSSWPRSPASRSSRP